jgi:hypothetical protein
VRFDSMSKLLSAGMRLVSPKPRPLSNLDDEKRVAANC